MAEDPTPAAAAAASDAPEAPIQGAETRIRTAVRAWRDEHIAGGPIARTTACWNQLEAALDALTASISKEI
jgi:hypothetical protein